MSVRQHKQRQRVRVIGTLTIALLALTACNSEAESESDPEAGATALVAGLWPTSGENASYGEWWTNATQLAVDEINAQGGLNGQTEIELVIEDTQALPDRAVSSFQGLVGRDVNLVLSGFSSQTLALLPIAEENTVPVVNGGAQSSHLSDASEYLFNTMPLVNQESDVLAEYLSSDTDLETAAVLYTTDDAGEAAYEDFSAAFEDRGGEVIASESGEYLGTDYRSQLTLLRESGADVLVLGAFGQDSNNMISQAREIGWDVQIANTSWVAIPEVLENPAAEGLIHTIIPWNPSQEFVESYEEAFGSEPDNSYIGNYYDGVMVWAEAYERASNGGDREPSNEEIIAEMSATEEIESAYGTPLQFDDKRDASRAISIAVIEDTSSVVLEENYNLR